MGDHSWLSVETGDSVPLRVFMVRSSRFTARAAAVAASVAGAFRSPYQSSGLQTSPEGAAGAGKRETLSVSGDWDWRRGF